MCSETSGSEAVGTTWEHAQLEFQKFLKIRIPLLYDGIGDNRSWMKIAFSCVKSVSEHI